jgi:hypothetical protein
MCVTCFQCEKHVGSYVHTAYDDDGNGTNPMCDSCADLARIDLGPVHGYRQTSAIQGHD